MGERHSYAYGDKDSWSEKRLGISVFHVMFLVLCVTLCVHLCGCTEKTEIIVPPESQTVMVGSDVTLHCNATTDELERRKLKTSWLLNREQIEFGSRMNVAQYDRDKSLKITQAQVDNTGNYTCNASNELDWDAVTVRLVVQGTGSRHLRHCSHLVISDFSCCRPVCGPGRAVSQVFDQSIGLYVQMIIF